MNDLEFNKATMTDDILLILLPERLICLREADWHIKYNFNQAKYSPCTGSACSKLLHTICWGGSGLKDLKNRC